VTEDCEGLFGRLKADLDKAMSEYQDPAKKVPRARLAGTPKPDSFFERRIAEMRGNLSTPDWIEIAKRDTVEEIKSVEPIMLRCVRRTGPESDYFLAYCPERTDYLLVQRVGAEARSIGIWGDPIGCYAAM